MTKKVLHALLLAPLLFGCSTLGSDSLIDWRDRLTLRMSVGDYEHSLPVKDFYVGLQGPDMSAVPSNDVHCPTLDATLLVNGVKLPQVDPGHQEDSWFGDEEDDDPCFPPQFGLQGALPPALLSPLTRIQVSDDSATFVAEIENVVAAPTLAFPAGATSELHVGATVTLGVTPPEPAMLGQAVSLWFLSDDPTATSAVFLLTPGDGIVAVDEQSVTFVVPDVAPASGTLVLRGSPLGPQVLACNGFAGCEVPPTPIISSSAPLAASVLP